MCYDSLFGGCSLLWFVVYVLSYWCCVVDLVCILGLIVTYLLWVGVVLWLLCCVGVTLLVVIVLLIYWCDIVSLCLLFGVV